MKKLVCLSLATAFQLFAESGFSIDSLVLSDGPKLVDIISVHNETSANFAKDLDEAMYQAGLEKKPIFLVVVGSSACPWSEKLLFDVIYQNQFIDKASKDFIVCKLNYDDLKNGGKELGLEKGVEKIPSALILSHLGEVISLKDDLPENPEKMLSYMKEATGLNKKISEALLQEVAIEDESLVSFYKLSKDLGLKLEERLYSLGESKKKNLFFQLEKYKKILAKGSGREQKDLKFDILKLDPKNSKGAIRDMALLEFEQRSKQKKGLDNPFSALKPLFEYLRDYGHFDKENRWQIEMKIAQFLYSKNQIQAAIQHATRSLEWVPEEHKKEVGDAVDFLKSQRKLKLSDTK